MHSAHRLHDGYPKLGYLFRFPIIRISCSILGSVWGARRFGKPPQYGKVRALRRDHFDQDHVPQDAAITSLCLISASQGASKALRGFRCSEHEESIS